MTARVPLCLVSGMIAQLPFGDTLDASVTSGPVADFSVITATNPAGSAVTNGQPVYISAAGVMSLAQANNIATTKVVALVQEPSIASGASGAYQTRGVLTATDWTAATGSATLTAGADYFLDPGVAGRLTTTPPSTAGQYLVFIGQAISATELALAIHRPIALASSAPSFNAVLALVPQPSDISIVDHSPSAHTVYASGGGVALSTAVPDPWGGSRKVMSFPGGTSHLYLLDSPDWIHGTADFTLEAWIRPNSLSGQQGIIGQFHNGTGSFSPMALVQDGANANIYCSSTGSSWDIAVATPIDTVPALAWTHLAITRSGGEIRGYKNAVLKRTIAANPDLFNSTEVMLIGAVNTSGANTFSGYIGAILLTQGVALAPSQFMFSSPPQA